MGVAGEEFGASFGGCLGRTAAIVIVLLVLVVGCAVVANIMSG